MAANMVEEEGGVVRTTIRIPHDLRDAVNAVAEASGTSFNGVVTVALIDFVSADEQRTRVSRFFAEGQERFRSLIDKLSTK